MIYRGCYSQHCFCSLMEEEGVYEENYGGEVQYDCVALHDYVAASEGELSFKAGDSILVTSEENSGWYSAVVNGVAGFVPANYVQLKGEGGQDDAAARKAKRQKMLQERRELKAVVDEKRARRVQLEEEVKYLEDYNRERKALVKRLQKAKGSDNPLFVLYDLLTLALAAESLGESHASYAERSSTLMMGLTSIQGLITKETKPGHPLEENLRKVSEIIESTRQIYAKSGEKLNSAIQTQKEFEPLLEKVRSSFAQYNS